MMRTRRRAHLPPRLATRVHPQPARASIPRHGRTNDYRRRRAKRYGPVHAPRVCWHVVGHLDARGAALLPARAGRVDGQARAAVRESLSPR